MATELMFHFKMFTLEMCSWIEIREMTRIKRQHTDGTRENLFLHLHKDIKSM